MLLNDKKVLDTFTITVIIDKICFCTLVLTHNIIIIDSCLSPYYYRAIQTK